MDEISHLRIVVKQYRAVVSLITGKRESSIVDFLEWEKQNNLDTFCKECGECISPDINYHTDTCPILQDYKEAMNEL